MWLLWIFSWEDLKVFGSQRGGNVFAAFRETVLQRKTQTNRWVFGVCLKMLFIKVALKSHKQTSLRKLADKSCYIPVFNFSSI